nr:hypothetical protein CFP56_57655 [Quercus suber]
MAETQAASLRVHNVSLHGRGRSNHGTLRLEKHHLTFTFTTEDGGGSRTPSARNPLPAIKGISALNENPSLPRTDVRSPTVSDPAADNHVAGKTSEPRRKPKTIWIPYPMVNSCVLRPSNAQSHMARLHGHDTSADDFSNDGIDPDGWPSTHGTSRVSTDSTLAAAP